MKKIAKYLIIISIFFIQLLVINNNTLFGVKPNLLLIFVFLTSLWYGLKRGLFVGYIIGMIMDLIYSSQFPTFTLSYTLIGLIVGLLNSHYIKENKVTVLYVTIYSTFVFELSNYIINSLLIGQYQSMFLLFLQFVLATLLNIGFSYLINEIMIKINNNIENELNMNRGF